MAEEKKTQKTDEEVAKEVAEQEKKKSDERVKMVDETVAKIHEDVEKSGDPKAFVKDVADRVAKTQVIAAGASYGPSPAQMEELTSQEFPIVAPPLPDGTPVANIAQVEKKEDKTAKPKSGHAVAGK